MTAETMFVRMLAGQSVPGRHVLVTAHPDDETISMGGALSSFTDALILQLTDGSHADSADAGAQERVRRRERDAALYTGGWSASAVDCGVFARAAHQELTVLLNAVRLAVADADVVWTHPYEGGHIDHDTASWMVQTVCAEQSAAPLRMEFASYYSQGHKADVFGSFWPDRKVADVVVTVSPAALTRKRAAIAAYTSQASILRKFPRVDLESYRQAPVYDFSKPAPPPASRWDVKGYRPTTAEWRQVICAAEKQLREAA